MDSDNDISVAVGRVLLSRAWRPKRSEIQRDERKLNISVVFTSVEATLAALRKAGTLASDLGARITLLVPQLVPYPLPLDRPPVPLHWNERRFRVIAGASPVETVVRLFLCRDEAQALEKALAAGSLVVIGGPTTWWPFNREKRLAEVLRRGGHEVIYTETE